MPPAVDYFRGAAYFHTGRHDEASLALSQNMKRAGREGYHYQQCLELMSLGSRCAAFPERNSAGGSSRPPGANSKWPAKRLAPCPGHIQSSLLADHFLVLENHPQISDPSLFGGTEARCLWHFLRQGLGVRVFFRPSPRLWYPLRRPGVFVSRPRLPYLLRNAAASSLGHSARPHPLSRSARWRLSRRLP